MKSTLYVEKQNESTGLSLTHSNFDRTQHTGFVSYYVRTAEVGVQG